MDRITILAMMAAVTLFAGLSLAADVKTNISSLPNRGNVTVNGTVDKIRNDQQFVLRDSSGTIDVKVPAGTAANLPRVGDSVTVSGVIERRAWGLFGKDINASSVQVQQKNPASLNLSAPNGRDAQNSGALVPMAQQQ